MRLTWPILSLVLGACTGTPGSDSQTIESKEAALAASSCWTQTLPWGSGAAELGLAPRGYEQVARGPQAIAVGDTGEVFVLDSENGRVLGITATTKRTIVSGLARDTEDLAIGPDGAFAVHSPLQATTWIFDADGAPAGELAIPRSFRSLVGISLSGSRDVVVRSAYQETYSAGSPAAPKDLATMLSQKREGAFQTDSGEGTAIRVDSGHAELVLLRSDGRDGRSQVSRVHAIRGEVSGAHIVGVQDDIACLRLEHVTQPGQAIEVHRRAFCMNVASGAVALDSAMNAPTIYKPRHEMAFGGTTPVLATLKPSASGMTVEVCEVLR